MHCALGLAQLERIDELFAARARVAGLYSRALADIPEIALPTDPPVARRSWFVYPIRLCGFSPALSRECLIAGLRERGIASRAYFAAIHRQPYFRGEGLVPRRPLPQTDAASESCLALPLFPSMTEEQVADVCTAVREILAEVRTAREMLAENTARVAP